MTFIPCKFTISALRMKKNLISAQYHKVAIMEKRIVSCDVGHHYTGVVVVDVRPGRTFEIVHLEACVDTSVDKEGLMAYLEKYIDPFVIEQKTIVVLENVYMYRNWTVQRINKKIRAHFQDMGVEYKYLLPSQKSYGTNISSGKKNSVAAATRLLTDIGVTHLVEKFESIERNHDIADALLMARYMYEHPEVLYKKTKR